MTREQAIAHGKEQLEIFGGEHREFIELAIQALEREDMANEIIEEQERIERDFNRNQQTMCFATAKNIHDTQLSNLMANQALEQTSEDCISREAVIKAVDNHTIETEKGLLLDEDISIILEDLPSIHPEKGEWIRHTRVEDVYDIKGIKTWGIKHQCNKCTFTTIAIEDFGYYDYCPNCGADMRGK